VKHDNSGATPPCGVPDGQQCEVRCQATRFACGYAKRMRRPRSDTPPSPRTLRNSRPRSFHGTWSARPGSGERTPRSLRGICWPGIEPLEGGRVEIGETGPSSPSCRPRTGHSRWCSRTTLCTEARPFAGRNMGFRGSERFAGGGVGPKKEGRRAPAGSDGEGQYRLMIHGRDQLVDRKGQGAGPEGQRQPPAGSPHLGPRLVCAEMPRASWDGEPLSNPGCQAGACWRPASRSSNCSSAVSHNTRVRSPHDQGGKAMMNNG